MKAAALVLLAALLVAGCASSPGPGGNGTNITNSTNTTVPPGYEVKDYCVQDSDCVRLNSCCDCGPGTYVNKYNQAPECPPNQPRCMCATQLSHGACQDSKCVAVPDVPPPTGRVVMNFTSTTGYCGDESAPVLTATPDGLSLNGSVGGGDVCRYAQGHLETADGAYILNITTRAIPGVDTCINCRGAIPWNATISGYGGDVSVYYDGRKVYPAPAGFCGSSTDASCSADSDCVTGGCSGQVCQGASEEPAITTCIYRDCYDAAAAGVKCGCVAGRCQWG